MGLLDDDYGNKLAAGLLNFSGGVQQAGQKIKNNRLASLLSEPLSPVKPTGGFTYRSPSDAGLPSPREFGEVLANSQAPGLSDVMSGLLALDDLRKGDYGSAGLNGLGLLPFVPALGGMLKVKGNMLGRLPTDPAAYTVVSKGSLGQDVLLNGNVIATVGGKKSTAVENFLGELDHAKLALDASAKKSATRAVERQRIADSSKVTNQAITDYGDLIASAHKRKELSFTPMDNAAFSDKSTILVHQSPAYGSKQGSEYRIVDIGGEPAYARQSDHWGPFSTADWKNGEQVWSDYNWQLPGVNTSIGNKDRYSGYVLLRDLLEKK